MQGFTWPRIEARGGKTEDFSDFVEQESIFNVEKGKCNYYV